MPLQETQLAAAAAEAAETGRRIGECLIDKQLASEEQVFEGLAEQFELPFVASLDGSVNEELIRDYPIELFRDGRCLPVERDDRVLTIAVADPLDLDILLEVEALTGMLPAVSLTRPSEMLRMHKVLFGGDSLLSQSADRISREYQQHSQTDEPALSEEEIKKRTESEPVVKMVSLVFDEAIKLRASDVHIEPTETGAVIRFRIDGMLRQHMEVSRPMYAPITSRIKILADLDIAEKRTPQDGRIRYTYRRRQFDFRVSTLPTHHGEKTVVRILKHDKTLLDLANLGMPQKELSTLLELIEKPQGMVFVTGPTGSGKSSTLFACLNRIRHKAINITTIENPIEYKLDGVNQVQINEKAGVSFAKVLRSILRQDPDVILIGEIRDPETAQIAVQASQTGHLVLSTLHTNDAISAVTRIGDLGIPGYLMASSILGVLAQRLVRRLCPNCKRAGEVSAETRSRWNALLGNVPLPDSNLAVGCEQCGNTGYAGRTGIFELIPTDETLRDMFSQNASETKIRHYVRQAGVKSLIGNGVEQIEKGVTTPEELLRVVLVEDVIQVRQ